MTIKELENKTGMTRANIRFYEGEGLLSPRRLDNGYRDYSEEDARTLEKIKLLRQLQLDIDTIRRVQQGTLTLERALFVQTTKLEGDKAVIQRAAEVCRDLERSGVEYAALEPQPYLLKLETSARPVLPSPPPPTPREVPDNTPRACCHPWQRWLARMLDMSIYQALFDGALLAFRNRDLVQADGILGWLLALLTLAFTLAVEPLWLHYWGWTPGKWVFGLKLRDKDGNKLTISQGLHRGWNVFMDGYGMNIPIWNLWKMWQCRKMGLEGQNCYWDGENDYRYTKEERRVHPAVIFVLVTAASVAVLVMGLKYTETPPNRGGLTVAEFAENYAYYSKMLERDSDLLLDGEGRWVEQEETPGVATIYPFGNTTVWDDPKFTVENGRVTAVTLHMESEDNVMFSGLRECLALLALSGAADGTDLFHYDLMGWARLADETLSRWEDVELDYRGLHISQQVDYSGYDVRDTYLWGKDGEGPHCEKTATISLIE